MATASSRVMWTLTKCASVQHTPGVGHARQLKALCSKLSLMWVWKRTLPRFRRATASASVSLRMLYSARHVVRHPARRHLPLLHRRHSPARSLLLLGAERAAG